MMVLGFLASRNRGREADRSLRHTAHPVPSAICFSRGNAIEESSTTYVSYAYNGLGRMVEADYEQPEIRLQYTDGDADDDYEGLDRFGRVIDQRRAAGSFLWPDSLFLRLPPLECIRSTPRS